MFFLWLQVVMWKPTSFSLAFLCVNDSEFGVGNLNDLAEGACDRTEVGKRIAQCQINGTWKVVEEQCILKEIQELLDQSKVIYLSYLFQVHVLPLSTANTPTTRAGEFNFVNWLEDFDRHCCTK